MESRQPGSQRSDSRRSETLSRHTDSADDSPLRDRRDGFIELGDMANEERPVSTVQTAPESEKQYAEFDPHSGPQVVSVGVGVPPSTVGAAVGESPGDQFSGQADDDLEDAGDGVRDEPQTAANAPKLAVVGGWPKRTWLWIRRKPYLAAAAVSLVVGLLALIILPVVLHYLPSNGRSSDVFNLLPVCYGYIGNIDFFPASYIPSVAQCNDTAKWTANVSYMGVVNSGGKAWPYKLLASSDATACCMKCFTSFPDGCQGWSYLPWDDTPVPCSIIYGWNSTSGVSATCPDGKAQMQFSTDSSRQGSFGNAGPCGSAAST